MVSILPWQRLLRRDLLILYLVIFLADVVVGYILPLFPLLALALGGGAMLILASQSGYGIYMAALAMEGVSFGMFLTAGQAFVTHHAYRRALAAG